MNPFKAGKDTSFLKNYRRTGVVESLGCTIGKEESGGKDKRVVFIGGMGEGRRERG